RLLDIGCGTGYFAGLMQRAGWTVEGVEANHGARQLAIERYGLKVYTPDDFSDLADEKYDVITLWHVLEHVHDLDGYLLKIRSLLDNNSKLILALPNYTSYDARAYGALWAAYDAPRHLYNFTPGAVDKLVRRHNFSISSMAPMPLDAYYVSLESEKHRDNGGSLVRGAVLGFRSNLAAAGKPEKSSSVIYVCEPF
ncbi:MAG: class I SAM-dependent methyltransferase, partial [Candidatus Marinimicrobia bacterium]|nr:class I SAM-dependent methyltransferase [Candidatus Neomarinimicrobiota bacterium]